MWYLNRGTRHTKLVPASANGSLVLTLWFRHLLGACVLYGGPAKCGALYAGIPEYHTQNITYNERIFLQRITDILINGMAYLFFRRHSAQRHASHHSHPRLLQHWLQNKPARIPSQCSIAVCVGVGLGLCIFRVVFINFPLARKSLHF